MTPNEFLDTMINSSSSEFRLFIQTQEAQSFMENMANDLPKLSSTSGLDIYKKALKLSCESLANNYCTEYCPHKYYECNLRGVQHKECFNRMINDYIEEFLQKAREENANITAHN